MEQHPLVAFIEARLAEDERTLLEAGDTDPTPNHQLYVLDDNYRHSQVVIPASRARREIEAKRQILVEHRPDEDLCCTACGRDSWEENPGGYLRDEPEMVGVWRPAMWPCRTVQLLGAPYADHSEYATLVDQTDTR